ncbi:MAG: DMT family transporter [Bacteroidales bacterium]
MKNQQKAYTFALITVLLWSTMSTAFKLSLSYLSFDQLLFRAVWFALISVGIWLMISGKSKILFQISRKDFIRSAILGFLNPFAYYLVLFKAYELLQAQEAGVLNYTWPVVLVILSAIFLHQKIGWTSFGAILLSFFGLIIISTKGDLAGLKFTNPLGVVLAVGSSFIWASYWIINLKDHREEVSKIFLNLVFGAFYILIYMLLGPGIHFNSTEAWIGAAYIGTLEMGITFVLWLLALQYSHSTAKVSNLIFLSPFIALFFIRIFVGEKILLSTISGLFFIISGIALQQWASHHKSKLKSKS